MVIVKRVFFLYDIPLDQIRGGHAHKELHQVLIVLNGSLEVEEFARTGETIARFVHVLNSPSVGLYIPPMIWTTERKFSDGAVCMALASDHFDESDYIRDFGEFTAALETNP